jgi:hypothetical protein
MADHSVRFTVPYRDLGRSDLKFKIYAKERRDRHLIGTLYISHGAIEWRSRKKHKEGTIKLTGRISTATCCKSATGAEAGAGTFC